MQHSQQTFDVQKCRQFVEATFTNSALPSLSKFIQIQNVTKFYYYDRTPQEWSQGFDKLLDAANHIKDWVESLAIEKCSVEVKFNKIENRTPIVFTVIDASGVGDNKEDTIVFYGHLDKQPPLAQQLWTNGRKPYVPSLEPKQNPIYLYGRGGADDGYSTYGTMLAIKALQEQKIPHPRFVMITEGDEETGSGDIDYWLQQLRPQFGTPKMVFCLDAGTVDYNRFWLTTSLRGYCGIDLKIKVLEESVHSGDGSGRIPTCHRILRMLLNRIQKLETGEMPLFDVEIPQERVKEIDDLVKELGEKAHLKFKTVPYLQTPLPGITETIKFGTWRAGLQLTGFEGSPAIKESSNIIIPYIKTRISIRLPPTLNSQTAKQIMLNHLTKNIPYKAEVIFDEENVLHADGFSAPQYGPELLSVIDEASRSYFDGKTYLAYGDGGSIPFIEILRKAWPSAKFIVTGVCGPESNIHGPNEFLHIPYLKKVICCMSHILAKSTPILFK